LFGHPGQSNLFSSLDDVTSISHVSFSCATVDFCLNSGVSTFVFFVTLLSGILTSAFYRYSIHNSKPVSLDGSSSCLIDRDDDDDDDDGGKDALSDL
jgi:hypothetical protein